MIQNDLHGTELWQHTIVILGNENPLIMESNEIVKKLI